MAQLPNRAAGFPSSPGFDLIEPKNRGRVLRTTSWQVVYDGSHAPKHESETRAEMYSTLRDSVARLAAREVLAAPSLAKGQSSLSAKASALRASHVNVGFERPGEVVFRRQTETKQSFTEQPLPILQSAAENKRKLQSIQKSSIDLAFGVEKTGKAWQSDQKESLANDADRKWACEGRPGAIDGSRNYKTQVQLGDHFSPNVDQYVTEAKCQFAAPSNPESVVSYAATLGKELMQHNWDNAMGRNKTTTQWMPANKTELARMAPEKFQARRPALDPALAKALRQSSVYLGKDAVEWGSRNQGIMRSRSTPGVIRTAALGVSVDDMHRIEL